MEDYDKVKMGKIVGKCDVQGKDIDYFEIKIEKLVYFGFQLEESDDFRNKMGKILFQNRKRRENE